MILELTDHKGAKAKICCVVFAGVLGTHPEELYYQQVLKRNEKRYFNERFVPLSKIERWCVRC